MRAAQTNVASLRNNWLEIKSRTLDVDVLAVTEICLRPGEGENELLAQEHSFLRRARTDGMTRGGMLILVTEKYDEHQGRKPYAPNFYAVEVNITNGG